ncbi:MAG: hypothetical protein K0S08_1461 [Gammaproteobacteria bacterium]|jgi:hypothetical protein|nr:hypothetical protein [Gammaproteobacteria bacterium]
MINFFKKICWTFSFACIKVEKLLGRDKIIRVKRARVLRQNYLVIESNIINMACL